MPGPFFHVAIIGGGASGVLTAAQLHRQQPDLSVALIDSTDSGRGLAYGTPHLVHLLNVPAGNMSAFPDQPEHFHYWLRQVDPWAARTTFAPRKLYGDYLNQVLDEACRAPSRVERITGTAVAVERGGEGRWNLRLEDGRAIGAKSVVLALGNLPPVQLGAAKGLESSRYVNDPWADGAVSRQSSDDSVLLVGTGLTAIDIVLALRSGGFRGTIHALSRRGLLPRAHAPCTPWTLSDDFAPSPVSRLSSPADSPRSMLKWLRREVELAERAGSNWRAVIDGLRQHTQRIWSGWSEAERRRFLRHARAWWEVHRHRAAPQIASAIEAEMAAGTVVVHRGRIVAIEEARDGLVVQWRGAVPDVIRPSVHPPIHSNKAVSLTVDRIYNCTGPDSDFARLEQPLVSQMRDAGLLTPDRLRLGIETDEQGRVLDQSGVAIEGLWAVGPLRKPRLWESTAMPEIRVQAQGLGGIDS